MTAHDDAAFATVVCGSRTAHSCSPDDPGPEWRGIRIRVPARVAITPGGTEVPVCGLYTLDLLAIRKAPVLRLLALDQATGLSYGGAVIDRDASPIAPDPVASEPSDADLEGLATSSYFNENLLRRVRLPLKPGRYTVTVEYGEQRSNAVSVDLVVDR